MYGTYLLTQKKVKAVKSEKTIPVQVPSIDHREEENGNYHQRGRVFHASS